MNSREDFTQKYQAQVNEWRPKVDGLTLRVERLSPEGRYAVQSHLDTVNSRFQTVHTNLDYISASTDAEWDGVRATAERAWNEFKSALEGAYTVLKSSAQDRKATHGDADTRPYSDARTNGSTWASSPSNTRHT